MQRDSKKPNLEELIVMRQLSHRQIGQVKRNRLKELNEQNIDTSTMRKGSVSPRSSRKRGHGDNNKKKLR